MPSIGPRTPADRERHTRDGVISDIRGNMFQEPSNYFPNWRFSEINDNQAPVGFKLGTPLEPDGYTYFISQLASGADTLAAQNAASLSINRPSFFASQPWVNGHPPKDRDSAAKVRTPQAPTVQLVDNTQMGFDVGQYYIFYNYIDFGDKHTTLSPEVAVNVTSTGQSIRLKLPQNNQEIKGAKYIGIWMTPKNGAVSDAYLQRQIDISRYIPADYLLSGPFRTGRKPPTRNETYLGGAPVPRWSWLRQSAYTTVPGRYYLACVYNTRAGNSGWTLSSSPITVSSPKIGYVIKVLPSSNPPGVISWRVYVMKFDDPSGTSPSVWYTPADVYHDPGGEVDRPFLGLDLYDGDPGIARPASTTTGSHVDYRFDGHIEGGGAGGLPGRQMRGGPYASPYALIQRDPPDVDLSGIPTPNAPLEAPTLEGTTTLAPGPYYFAVAHTVGDDEGLPSAPVKVTVPSGKLPRILPADPVNYFVNAEGIEVNQANVPFDHTFTPNSGTISITGGIITYSSAGSLTTGFPIHKIKSRPIDPTREYWIGETQEVTVTSGAENVFIEQLDVDGVLLVRHLVKVISGSGVYDRRTKIRPAVDPEPSGTLLSNGELTFHDRVTSVQVAHEMPAGTNNLAAYIKNMYMQPAAVGQPRKRVVAPLGTREPANSNPTPNVPFPNVSQGAVELPPQPPSFAPAPALAPHVGFEDGALPSDWTLYTKGSGYTQAVSVSYAIGGSYGWRISRTDTSRSWVALTKTMTPSNRLTLAVRAKYRNILNSEHVILMEIDNDSDRPLGFITLFRDGNMRVETWNPTTHARMSYKDVKAGVGDSDVLDIEMIVKRNASGGGVLEFWMGKNGTTRSLQASITAGSSTWGTSAYPTRPFVGAPGGYGGDPGFWTFDIDDIVVTDTGDVVTTGSAPVGAPSTTKLEPIPTPDRPYVAGPTLDTVTDFEGNSIPVAWTTTRSPADATTTVAVQTASAIEGTYGLRVSDTGSASTASAYIQRAVPGGPMASLGVDARFRVVTLPATGQVRIMAILSGTTQIAYAYLKSSGELWVQPTSAGGADFGAPAQVAGSLAAASTFTLEFIARGAGTTGSTLQVWVTKGSGPRQLMWLFDTLSWSTLPTDGVRVGLFDESATNANGSLDIDYIRLTAGGSVVYREYSENGDPIYQVHCYYPDGTQLEGSGLFLGTDDGESIAVEPGKSYTAAFTARVTVPTDQAEPARPFFFVARNSIGGTHDLGSLYGDSGVTGVRPWEEVQRTFIVPEDCYEVYMESRNIGGGEFVAQEPVWTSQTPVEGVRIDRERTFPLSGTARVVLDSRTPFPALPIARKWLDVASTEDTPEGTSISLEYASGRAVSGPFTSFVNTPEAVPEDNVLVIKYTFSSDGTDTASVDSGFPLLDYAVFLGGKPLSTLLRDDGTEFPGGVILSRIVMPRDLSKWDTRFPHTDRVIQFRQNEPVTKLPPFEIFAYTEEAINEIEETYAYRDFHCEAHGWRMRIRFFEAQQISFDYEENDLRYDQRGVVPVRFTRARAKVAGAEVYDPGLLPGVYEI